MIKIYLSEYAKAKQAMEDNIGNRVDIIIEHLIKCILLPESNAYKHWQGEIAGQLNRVHKIKGKNKYPTYEQLYDWTYHYAQDDITDINWLHNEIQNIEDEYNCTIIYNARKLSQQLDKVCEVYFNWLCSQLARYGSVPNSQIYAVLDNLI